MVVSSFAIGALGITVFQLGLVDGVLTTIFINLLAITPVAFFSGFGARTGLRQMILSRYYFGFNGVKIGLLCSSIPAGARALGSYFTITNTFAEKWPSSISLPVWAGVR